MNVGVNYGLFYNGVLLSVMSFCRPRFQSTHHHADWELARYCVLPDWAISGGAQRLFHAFVKDYAPQEIVTYCDIGKFTGSVYHHLNFHILGSTAPTYSWIHRHTLMPVSRMSCRKSKLDGSDQSRSEAEMMHERGFEKTYNCGIIVYIWKYDGGDNHSGTNSHQRSVT